MTAHLYVATYPGAFHLAVMKDGLLVDFAVWWPDYPQEVGAIYGGRVKRYEPSIQGAFVDIGEKQDGFLPISSIKAPFCEGDYLCVEVVRSAQNKKGPRLKYLHRAKEKKKGQIQAPLSPFVRLCRRWEGFGLSIYVDTARGRAHIPKAWRVLCVREYTPLPEEVAYLCAQLFQTHVNLTAQMSAIISPTAALTAIDMDLRPSRQTQKTKQAYQWQENLRAFPALVRQIYMRQLSGAILIDMAGLSIKNRIKIVSYIHHFFRKDPLKPRCLGMTRLGLLELVRARKFRSLNEQIKSNYGRALELLRYMVEDVPQACVLKASRVMVRQLESMKNPLEQAVTQRKKTFDLCTEPSWSDDYWQVLDKKGDMLGDAYHFGA